MSTRAILSNTWPHCRVVTAGIGAVMPNARASTRSLPVLRLLCTPLYFILAEQAIHFHVTVYCSLSGLKLTERALCTELYGPLRLAFHSSGPV